MFGFCGVEVEFDAAVEVEVSVRVVILGAPVPAMFPAPVRFETAVPHGSPLFRPWLLN